MTFISLTCIPPLPITGATRASAGSWRTNRARDDQSRTISGDVAGSAGGPPVPLRTRAVADHARTLAIMGGLDKRALARDRAATKSEVDRVLPHFAGQS